MDIKDKIFPAEVIEHTSEYHFYKYNPKTNIIYRIVLGAVILTFILMLFVKVNISVSSTGIIKSPVEHNEVKILVSGKIDSVFIKENTRVKSGQILMTIKSDMVNEKNKLIESQQNEFETQVKDLEVLAFIAKDNKWGRRPVLESGLYKQQFALFNQRISEALSNYTAHQRNYNRNSYLYRTRAISTAEFDVIRLGYQRAQNDLQLIYDEQGSKWQADLNNLRLRVQELKSQNEQYKQQKEFYTLRAPLSGTVQHLKGIQPGGFISANEIIAEISPDSGLVAEMYVLPQDIGLIYEGIPARFRVDAFNYNEWGALTGKVISVSNDIYTESGQQPFFKVRCKLDNTQLTLKNGYSGKLKKGMTLQASFFVTRRTLFQLMYDKADDWLNPAKKSIQSGKSNSTK